MSELQQMDPNENWGVKTIRLTFMCWDYKREFETTVGGNTLGHGLFSVALGSIYEDLPANSYGAASLTLFRDDGDEVSVDDEEQKGEDWLGDMLVAAEIIRIEPKPYGVSR